MIKSRQVVENKIYAAIIGECEGREYSGMYHGNGHHLAQLLARKVSEALLPPSRAKIYNALTRTPTQAMDIAKLVGMNSRVVSSQLLQMNRYTNLLLYKKKGRYKLWYREFD